MADHSDAVDDPCSLRAGWKPAVLDRGRVPVGAVDRPLQPFQRLGPDQTGHGDGLGLGLSIVQAIAQALGAVLALRPQPLGGLRAEVSFPWAEPTAPVPSPAPRAAAVLASAR